MTDTAFKVCTTHQRFYPCVSHDRSTCHWSSDEDAVWEVAEHILTTTPKQRLADLRRQK